MEGILSGGSSGMRAKAWFWFLVMLVIPTSTLAFVVGARSVWEGILGTAAEEMRAAGWNLGSSCKAAPKQVKLCSSGGLTSEKQQNYNLFFFRR